MKEPLFTYQITADDYLTHQLFSATINPLVKKQRRKGLILWTSAFFILAVIFLFQGNKILTIYFGLFGLGFMCLYPLYSRWIYKKYYKRFVYKNFDKANIENIGLRFTDPSIIVSSGGNEGEIPNSSIEVIYEILSHYFIKLEKGRNIIIPKSKIENKENFEQVITLLIQKNTIQYNKMLDWKWR